MKSFLINHEAAVTPPSVKMIGVCGANSRRSIVINWSSSCFDEVLIFFVSAALHFARVGSVVSINDCGTGKLWE